MLAPAVVVVSSSTASSSSSSVSMPPPPPPPRTSTSSTTSSTPGSTTSSKEAKDHHQQPPRVVVHHEEPSSSIPDLEFDGTTVLCRVCGDKASGFHYGVHSCEGCKGFFRRSIQQKIQYRPCTKNQQCSILRINRNRCQYCRLKKCIAVGMSRDAVRFGRVPKREKARILAAMQQSSNSRSLEKAVAAELEDEQRLLDTVVRAHYDTCDYTRDKVDGMLAQARDQPSYTNCPPTLACPLNPNPQPLTGQQELLQDFSKRFSPAIRGVVEFAKRIPGFSLLAQDDQVTLLKAGVFEVLLVRLACLFDAGANRMLCLNGQVLRRESIHGGGNNARFLVDSMFDFAERLNALQLSDAEVGLFCAVVVVAADRPGLRNAELVERMQARLRAALRALTDDHHHAELLRKIPDLRTLNTLHSEKLLAFKMTEWQQQQQKQQQQQLWDSMDEAKSPLGSVSSTESNCSGEVAAITASSAPLLAATLLCPHRQRANSGSTSSSGDDDLHHSHHHHHNHHNHHLQQQQQQQHHHHHHPHHHLMHNGITITPVVMVRPPTSASAAAAAATSISTSSSSCLRRLDSPSDSGIESGTDQRGEPAANKPSSLCSSSPRSSLEEPTTPAAHEDMPVLKRVLQAPPLYDTNSLMDEAYKPHKKFRALRPKDSEAEAAVQLHPTLAKSLMEGPRMTAEQQKRTDIIHDFIMQSSSSSSSSSSGSQQQQPPQPQPQPPHHHHQSVITTTAAVALQVDIAQPLNLSKKSPAASPSCAAAALEAHS